MNIFIEVLVALVVFTYGYVAMHCSFKNKKLREIKLTDIKPEGKKIIFIIGSVGALAVIIALLHILYPTNLLLNNVRLVSLLSFMLPIAVIDYKYYKIPNLFIASALIFRVLIFIVETINSPDNALNIIKDCGIGALIVGAFFFLVSIIIKNSIGMGDVKLFFVMGLYQGVWGVMNSVFFALVASFFVSIFLLVTKKKNKKDTIPFGPSILIGTLVGIALSGM